MRLPISPSLSIALQRSFGGCSEGEAVATMLLEYLRSDELRALAPKGAFFTDPAPPMLSQLVQSEVIPILQATGVRVAFCNLQEASTTDASSLVHDAVATLAGLAQPAEQTPLRQPDKRRLGPYSVDDGLRAAAAEFVLTAVDHDASDAVFIINAVEQLLSDIEGRSLLAGLQDACELLGSRQERAGCFLLVGIGTDDVLLDRLTMGSFKPARRDPAA